MDDARGGVRGRSTKMDIAFQLQHQAHIRFHEAMLTIRDKAVPEEVFFRDIYVAGLMAMVEQCTLHGLIPPKEVLDALTEVHKLGPGSSMGIESN